MLRLVKGSEEGKVVPVAVSLDSHVIGYTAVDKHTTGGLLVICGTIAETAEWPQMSTTSALYGRCPILFYKSASAIHHNATL